MAYKYDQLQRIKEARSFAPNAENWTYSGAYNTNYKYDANGNIIELARHHSDGSLMDDLHYEYDRTNGMLNHNRLLYVDDLVSAVPGVDDIEAQSSGNYEYDEIGNLTKDVLEGIENISWNVYGKIDKITRASGSNDPDLEFIYDGAGNRVVKIVKPAGAIDESAWEHTYYFRDGSGNIMHTQKVALDEDDPAITHYTDEHPLYGSNRLGVRTTSYQIPGPVPPTPTSTDLVLEDAEYFYEPGSKQYEMSNHLGNVLVTFTDWKEGIDNSADGLADEYFAQVSSANDYYPFGWQMPGRKYSDGEYRFGFNGMEQDDEMMGDGNSYDFGARMYDSRLGRWYSVDPLHSIQPGWSTYKAFKDNPIVYIDPNGETEYAAIDVYHNGHYVQTWWIETDDKTEWIEDWGGGYG